jgi:hypothetical protein
MPFSQKLQWSAARSSHPETHAAKKHCRLCEIRFGAGLSTRLHTGPDAVHQKLLMPLALKKMGKVLDSLSDLMVLGQQDQYLA